MSLDSSSEEEDVTSGPADLNPEQTEKLATLQDMTGIDDLGICRALLESQDWDLEATAREHLNIPPMMRDEIRAFNNNYVGNYGPSSPPPDVPPSENNAGSGGGGTTSIIISYGYSLLLFPFRFTYRVLQFVSSFFLSFFPSEPPSTPGLDVANFISAFRAEYESDESPESQLPFLPLSYHSALESAKKDLKFLLIYLHSPRHSQIHEFCIGTLKSGEFRDFLERRSHELLLWGASVESREGYNVSRALRESSYPFLSLIVLRQNRMVSVGRVEGIVDPVSLISALDALIADNEAFVVAARVDREERNMTQNLRQEQDAAFQESLRLDRERERAKREERERKEREELERQNEIRRLAERKHRIKQLKMDLVNFVPDEPQNGDPSAVRLVIKLPEGQRLERKFRKDHSLLHLYIYIFCHPDSPDEFDVTTNFPRTVLQCKPTFVDDVVERGVALEEVNTSTEHQDIPTFQSAGLEGSIMLFVTDLDA